MGVTRPGPLRWLRYAYGGRLPDRYREWVLHDTTDRGWLVRYALVVAAQALPWLAVVFVVLMLFTPVGLALGAVAAALALSLFFTLTSADELTEARLVKHGFAPGTGKDRRRQRHVSPW